MIEYNIIKNYCKTFNTNGLEMNKLSKIIQGDYYCCKDCYTPMKFIKFINK